MFQEFTNRLAEVRAVLNIRNISDYLAEVRLSETVLASSGTASGSYTLFDDYAPYQVEKMLPPLDARLLGQMSPHDASEAFTRRLVIASRQIIQVPIQEIQAIYASKSDTNRYASLDDFGKAIYEIYANDYIHWSTRAYFDHCLEAGLGEGGIDFQLKHWAPVLQWANSGGSHRFATARYIAMRENYPTFIDGSLTTYAFNHQWLDEVNQSYHSYLLTTTGHSTSALYDAFKFNEQDHSTIIYLSPPSGLRMLTHQASSNIHQILLLNRNIKWPRAIRQWLERQQKEGYLQDFHQLIQEYKAIEAKSMAYIAPYLQVLS